MTAGLGLFGALNTGTLARAVADELAEQMSVAKVLAAIAGAPMPHPNCDCTTCRYRWGLIRRFMPNPHGGNIMSGARRRDIPKVAR